MLAKSKKKLKESDAKSSKQHCFRNHLDEIKFRGAGKEGFVYLLKGEKYFKIGKTTSLSNRTRTLKIQLPFKCQLVHAIETNNIDSLEKFWHNRFVDKRKNGERFALSSKEINEFLKKVVINFD